MFVRMSGASMDLVRARLSDGSIAHLTDTDDRNESWPYWSPAAGRLVYQSAGRRAGGHAPPTDLMLWRPGGEPRPLLSTPARNESLPVWSPDGRRVVHVFRGPGSAAGIASIDVATGQSTLVARVVPPRFLLRPNFAPDGVRIVAEQRRDSGGTALRVLTPGEPPSVLTDEPNLSDSKAWFSRDGATIVFTRSAGSNSLASSDVFSIPSTGGSARPLFADPDLAEHSARPSPTRDEVVYIAGPDGHTDVFIANLDGSRSRPLVRTADVNEFTPRWSPDGEFFTVIAVPAGRGPGRLDDPDSLARIQLRAYDREGNLRFDTRGMMADWMPAWP